MILHLASEMVECNLPLINSPEMQDAMISIFISGLNFSFSGNMDF